MRRLIVICALSIILATPSIMAEQTYSITYRFMPRQILTYHETAGLKMSLGAKSISTLDVDRIFMLTVTEANDKQAKLSKKLLESHHQGTKMGEAVDPQAFSLPKSGLEVSFVTNMRGQVLTPNKPFCTLIMEGLPSHPVTVGSSWETWENNGTVHSSYTLAKIIPKNEQTTYYLLRGRHSKCVVEQTSDPKTGTPIRLVTETTGNSWVYFVAEWGQILSAEYTEDGQQTITKGENVDDVAVAVDIHQVSKIELKKIAR